MTPKEVLSFLENSIEPKLQEMGNSYAVLLDHFQYIMIYNGDLGKIAYMLGQTLQAVIDSQAYNSISQEYIQQEFIAGYNDPISPESKEDF